MKKSVFILFVLMTSFVFSQEEKVESPKIAIKILFGESITLEGHTVKFVKVLEDSRCPENTTCIWEGRARVRVEIIQDGEDTIFKELIFGKVNSGESGDKELFFFNESKVFGLTLNPYPNSKEALNGDPYVLLVYLEKQ